MRIVQSSDPDAVRRDELDHLVAECCVLTTTLCHELLRAEHYADHRPRGALRLLDAWLSTEAARTLEDLLQDVSDQAPPRLTLAMLDEIEAAEEVLDVYRLYLTADSVDHEHDRAALTQVLANWKRRIDTPHET